MSFHYIKEVLGVQQVIRPKKWEEFYILYGSLKAEYLLLSYEEHTAEQQELVSKIMQALNQKSFAVLHIKQFQLSLLHIVMERSSANKFIAFGEKWQSRLMDGHLPFHKVFSYSVSKGICLKGVTTYCLSEFLSPRSNQKKREAFAPMKALAQA